jgi:hypothetical protein
MKISQDAVSMAFRNTEALVISEEEKEIRDFMKPFFYEISLKCEKPESVVYMKKIDVKTASETQALYLWSAEPAGGEVRRAVKAGALLIEGKDIKQEYISRYLSSCSIG